MDLQLILFLTLLCVSCLIIIFMSFMEKRKSFKPYCCHGRPGLAVPVNLLDNYRNRFGYALSFGTAALTFVEYTFVNRPFGLLRGLAIIINAIQVGIMMYPFFICQTTKHQMVGSALGLLYCCLWIAFRVFTIYSRTVGNEASQVAVSFWALPEMLCVAGISLKFIKILFINIKHKRWMNFEQSQDDEEDDTKDYMIFYVRSLLRRSKQQQRKCERIVDKIKACLYHSRPEFKYPTRIVCTFFVSYVVVYILFVYFCYLCAIARTLLKSRLPTIIEGCCYSAICVATLRSCVVLFNMMCLYRRHVTKLRRGDRSWLPEYLRHRDPSPTFAMMASMKFAGLQIGYTIWGWSMSFLFGFLTFLAIALLKYNLYRTIVLWLIKTYWPTLLTISVIYLMQLIVMKCFFLMEKGKLMAINNRRAYHIFTYFLFFYNVFFGIFAGMLRLIKGATIGLIFLDRLQKSILPTTFERFDRGHKAYVGYVILENAHANPVMRCFIYILQEVIRSRTDSTFMSFEFNAPPQPCMQDVPQSAVAPSWKRARNRWQLAYTMLRNPSLVQYRKWRLNLEDKLTAVLL